MSGLPPGWASYTTDDGKEYYHNSEKSITTWDKPTWPDPVSNDLERSSFGTQDVYQPNLSELAMTSMNPGPSETKVKLQVDADLSGSLSPNPILSVNMQPMDIGGDAESGTTPLRDARERSWFKWFSCCELEAMQKSFDVNTADIKKRIRLAALPFGRRILQQPEADFRDNPDFYGPWWVATTVIIFLAATGNFALALDNSGEHITNFNLASIAAAMMYGALVAVPLLATGILWFSGLSITGSINLKQYMCVYGYSHVSLVPISCLCIIPSGVVRTTLCVLGLVMSIVFMYAHLMADLAEAVPRFKWALFAVLVACNTVIYMMYRFYFFVDHLSGTH